MLQGETKGQLSSSIKRRWCRESREPQAAPQSLGLCSGSHKNTLCTCFSKCHAEKIHLPNTDWARSSRERFQLCTTARPCSPAACHWIVATLLIRPSPWHARAAMLGRHSLNQVSYCWAQSPTASQVCSLPTQPHPRWWRAHGGDNPLGLMGS